MKAKSEFPGKFANKSHPARPKKLDVTSHPFHKNKKSHPIINIVSLQGPITGVKVDS
jgi:hypothetical protein